MTEGMIDVDRPNILPDSRLVRPVGSINIMGQYWQPIFCPNCGCDGGLVPEENMTFAFWICQPCAEKYGAIAGMMLMPDEVFWERLKQESFAHFGYYPTAEELEAVKTANNSPLATLLIQGA